MTLEYAAIADLVVDVRQEGPRLSCAFRCPVTGHVQQVSIPMGTTPAAEGVLSSVSLALGRALRAALFVAEAAELPAVPAPAAAGRQAAVVQAFLSLSPPFIWDAARGSWVSSAAAGDLSPLFTQQLRRAPLTGEADRRLAARMLAGVSKADGRITPLEWAFLGEAIAVDLGSVDDFMDLPPLGEPDLAGASPGPVRETLLMLAWLGGLRDRELTAAEIGQLERYAAWLGLTPEQNREMRRYALRFLLDEWLRLTLDEEGDEAGRASPAWAEACERARALELEPVDVDDVAARLCARRGLAPSGPGA